MAVLANGVMNTIQVRLVHETAALFHLNPQVCSYFSLFLCLFPPQDRYGSYWAASTAGMTSPELTPVWSQTASWLTRAFGRRRWDETWAAESIAWEKKCPSRPSSTIDSLRQYFLLSFSLADSLSLIFMSKAEHHRLYSFLNQSFVVIYCLEYFGLRFSKWCQSSFCYILFLCRSCLFPFI